MSAASTEKKPPGSKAKKVVKFPYPPTYPYQIGDRHGIGPKYRYYNIPTVEIMTIVWTSEFAKKCHILRNLFSRCGVIFGNDGRVVFFGRHEEKAGDGLLARLVRVVEPEAYFVRVFP